MDSSPIFTKTYDFALWLMPALTRFPKDQRFRMAARLEESLFRFQELLIRAARSGQRARDLEEADIELEKMRFLLRLAQDLKLFSFEQYEYSARLTSELGRLLGGWIKTTKPMGRGSVDRGDGSDRARGLLEQQ